MSTIAFVPIVKAAVNGVHLACQVVNVRIKADIPLGASFLACYNLTGKRRNANWMHRTRLAAPEKLDEVSSNLSVFLLLRVCENVFLLISGLPLVFNKNSETF